MSAPIRVGFDIGGVISKYPAIFRQLMGALESAGVEVHVLSDMPREKSANMLARNGFDIAPDRLHAADYDTHGEACKAIASASIGLDVLVDDFVGYVATPGSPAIRLLVMPDASRPYYDPTWETDGKEGAFGRVVSPLMRPRAPTFTASIHAIGHCYVGACEGDGDACRCACESCTEAAEASR